MHVFFVVAAGYKQSKGVWGGHLLFQKEMYKQIAPEEMYKQVISKGRIYRKLACGFMQHMYLGKARSRYVELPPFSFSR